MSKLTQVDINRLKDALKDAFSTKDELNAVKKELNDNIISFKDAILKKIQDLRTDVIITTGYRDMIEDHDVRIEQLERKVGLSKTP